jgi:hypothetical protein
MDVATKYPTLEERQEALGISKDTHPTEVAWLEKNGELVPWDRVKTLEQLREFVEQRVAQRMELGQYDLTAEGTIVAEGSEMRALRIKARNGDLEAVRAIELYQQGGWEMVLKGYFNPKRESNLDLWKWYLTDEHLEFAQDPFWCDLAWDIPMSYLQERGNFGMGQTAVLKPGVLDQLRDDIEFGSVDLPKAYRKLLRQLAASSEEDLPRDRGEKSWVYIPGRDEDPINYEANVQKLDKLVGNRFNTKFWDGESYLRDHSLWLLRHKRKMKLAILLTRSNFLWIKAEGNKFGIPDEYLEDVLNLLRREKMPGGDVYIASNTKDPKEQIKFAQSGNLEVVRSLAKNKQLDTEAQIIIANGQDIDAKVRLAKNSNIVRQAQIILAESGDSLVQENLAENRSIAGEVQVILAKSKHKCVTLTLAQANRPIPEAQEILAQSEDWETLEIIASKDYLIPKLQMRLAKREETSIRQALARNKKLMPKVQIILARSGDKWIDLYLASNRSLIPKVQLTLIQRGNVDSSLAKNPSICLKAQRILARSKNPNVRRSLAQNESITGDIQMLILANSKDNKGIQGALAKNNNLCPQAQLELAKSPYPEVRGFLSQRPGLTQEARQILETPSYSLQQSKEDAMQAKEQGRTQSQGIAK